MINDINFKLQLGSLIKGIAGRGEKKGNGHKPDQS
jgi:hypothetical protein